MDSTYIKSQFPIFNHHPRLVYLDNAATTQKPAQVLDAMSNFYEKENASVHRGLYELSAQATRKYEAVRTKVAQLIGTDDPLSIAFTKGTTESVNIVANSLRSKIQPGDNIVITAMEHHANLIPWQMLCKEKGATLRIIPVLPTGELDWKQLKTLLDNRTRLLAMTHISNVLGTINPIEEIIHRCHGIGIPVLVDAAQSAGHYSIEADKWKVDYLAFSAHKMFGPLGTGILYVSAENRKHITPLIFGGGAIKNVTESSTEFLDYPFHLEAGTPNAAGVIGMGAAIDFINTLDQHETISHTRQLSVAFADEARSLGLKILGNPSHNAGIISFYMENIHPHDIASYLGSREVAVRAGHHCAQPLLEALRVPATVRVSFSIYNSMEDIDLFMEAIRDLKKFWA